MYFFNELYIYILQMYFCFCVTGLPQTAMAIIADAFFFTIYYILLYL